MSKDIVDALLWFLLVLAFLLFVIFIQACLIKPLRNEFIKEDSTEGSMRGNNIRNLIRHIQIYLLARPF